MANLSNINNKFLVTTGGNVLIGQTAVVGTSILQVEGSTNAIIRMNSTAGTGGRMDFAYGGSNYGNIGSGKNILGTGNAADMMINADSLLILGVGSQDMTILPSGNVGIGTTSPDALLELEKSASGAVGPTLLLNNSAGGNTDKGNIIFSSFGNTYQRAKIEFKVSSETNNPGNIDFYTGRSDLGTLTQKMTILGSGNVGIGTASPSVLLDARLSGTTGKIAEFHNSVGYGIDINVESDGGVNTISSATNQSLAFSTSATERMRVAINGRIGIGTNTPVALLHLKQAAGANIRFENGTTNRVCTVGEGVGTNDVFSFRGNSYRSTDTLSVVFSTDRVGIGIITPNEKLQVAGNIHAYAPSGIDAGLFASTAAGNTTAAVRSSGISHFNGGNVGIGTSSPSRKLVVAQSNVTEPSGIDANTGILIKNNTWSGIQIISTEATGGFITFGDNAAGFAGRIQYLHATNAMVFETAASERMRIDSSGNVGIGGTSSGAKLEIIGGGYNSIRIGSNQTANTNKQSGISMNNYEGNGTSIFQTFQQNNDNSIYWGSADSGFRGVQNHYFMVNADSNATTGHTTAMRIASAGQIGIGRLTTSYKLSLITDSTAQNGVYISGGTGNGNHAFYVENQAGSAEFFAVRGDGEIRLNATSGHTYANTGIRFGANAVSNNLDDYEEGTFTMTMTNDGVGNTVTSRYTKVGRLVFIEAYFSSRTISNAGNCRVSGLPFSADASEGYGVLTYWHGTAISQNGTVFYVQGSIADGIAPGTTAYAQWVTGTNKAIMLAGFYTTA